MRIRILIHNPLTQEETVLVPEGGKGGKAGRVEGYLFKRGQNAFRTWNRRWFYLDSNKVGGQAVLWIRIGFSADPGSVFLGNADPDLTTKK
jgi:hypothetical protein